MKTFDLNKDGNVDGKDVNVLQEYLAGLVKFGHADVNENGIINMKDVVALQQFIEKYDINKNGIFSDRDIQYIQEAIADMLTTNKSMDVNEDGKVDMKDVVELQRVLKTAVDNFDIQHNNKIDEKDVTAIQEQIAEIIQIIDIQWKQADINNDAKISMSDVTTLQQILDKLQKLQRQTWVLVKYNNTDWTSANETMTFQRNGKLRWYGRANGIKSQYEYTVKYKNDKIHLICKALSPDSVKDVVFIIESISNTTLCLTEDGANRRREFARL